MKAGQGEREIDNGHVSWRKVYASDPGLGQQEHGWLRVQCPVTLVLAGSEATSG